MLLRSETRTFDHTALVNNSNNHKNNNNNNNSNNTNDNNNFNNHRNNNNFTKEKKLNRTLKGHTPCELDKQTNYTTVHGNIGIIIIVQELCESRGGRPGLSVLTSLLVSVDVKLY